MFVIIDSITKRPVLKTRTFFKKTGRQFIISIYTVQCAPHVMRCSSAMFRLTEVCSRVWEDAMSIHDLLLSEFDFGFAFTETFKSL
jgi:hypothetical protein